MTKTPPSRSIEFEASIPPIGKAIDFHGEGGARLQLDIPDSYKAAALELPAFFLQKRLRVRLEVIG